RVRIQSDEERVARGQAPAGAVRHLPHDARRAGDARRRRAGRGGDRAGGTGGRGGDGAVMTQRSITTIESASSAPIAMLNTLTRRSPRRRRCTAAPKASQTKPLGHAARKKSAPSAAACVTAPLPSALRNVPAALM